MIFSKGKVRNYPEFTYNGSPLEVVSDFRYLGIDFNYNGKFNKCKKHLFNQAQKAMFSLLRKSKNLGLPIDVQLHLFDHMVVPILLYGSEIWGFENNDIIEKLHLRFCRILLNVSNKSPKCMVYGELGRMPLQALIDQNVLNFWARILNANDKQISKILYNVTYRLNKVGLLKSDWILHVQNCLNNIEMYNLWISQSVSNRNCFKKVIKERLKNTYETKWSNDVFNNSKCYNYRMFKKSLIIENYLLKLPLSLRIPLTKYRLSNHKLPIECGRYEQLERGERKCSSCNVLGDEYHYLFQCVLFVNERISFLPKYYWSDVNAEKYHLLLSSSNFKKLYKLANFVKIILSEFK